MESIENVSDYHSVFARTIETTLQALLSRSPSEARMAMKFCIQYAYVQWKDSNDSEISFDTIKKEIESLKLDVQELDNLILMMSYYNAKANMKPVQNSDQKAKIFERIKNKW